MGKYSRLFIEPTIEAPVAEPLQGRYSGLFKEIGAVENFANSVLQTVPSSVAAYQAFFGYFKESEETMRTAEQMFPTRRGPSGFVGQAVGGILPTAGAIVFPPAAPFVLGHYAMQSSGTARQMVHSYERETGTEVSPAMETVVTIGFGAATYFAERMGLKMLNKTLLKAGIPAIKELGEAAVKGGALGFGKALLKTGLIEGSEEFVEQVAQNALTSLYDEDARLFAGTGESFALGFLGGAMLAPIGYSASYRAMRMDSPAQKVEDVKAVPRAAKEVPEVTPVGIKPEGVEDVRTFLGTQAEGKRLRVIPEKWMNRPVGKLLKTVDTRLTWGQLESEGLITTEPAKGREGYLTVKSAVAIKPTVEPAQLVDVLKQVAAQKEAMQRAEEAAPKVVTPGREERVEGEAEEGVRVRDLEQAQERKVTVEKGVDAKYGNLISGWLDILGIEGNLNIVSMEIGDSTDPLVEKMREKGFSGFGWVDDQGIVRIGLKQSIEWNTVETSGHEFGHIVYKTAWTEADEGTQNAVKEAYTQWYEETKGKLPNEVFVASVSPGLSVLADTDVPSSISNYQLDFNEWFANQVARWTVSAERPQSVIGRFFKSIADKLRRVYASLAGKQFLPDSELASWLDRRAAYVAGEAVPPPRAPVAKVAPVKLAAKPEKIAVPRHLRAAELTDEGLVDEIQGPFGMKIPAVPGPHNDTEYGQFLDQQYEESTRNTLTKLYFQELKKKLKTRIYDVRANVRLELERRGGKLGHQAMMLVDCQRGAAASAANKVQVIEKDLFGGLSIAKERLLADIIQARRTIEVETNPDIGDPDIIQPGSLGAEKAQEFLDAVPEAVMTEMEPKIATFTREFQKILEYGLGAGLITQEDFTNMSQTGFYSPRWFMSKLDPATTAVVGGKKIQVTDSGFQYLEKGATDYLMNDPRILLTESWARIIARDYKNRANAELYDLIIQDPENGMVIEDKAPSKAQPEGWTRLAYIENGKPVTFLMREDLAKEWVTSDKAMRADLAKFLYLVSGTKVLKMTATGYNPGFAVTNFFRDISLIWFATKEYSPNLLKGIPQLGQSLAATMKDAWTGTGTHNTYLDYGGGLTLLTQQGQIQNIKRLPYAPYINRGLNQVQGIMGKLGNFTEMWNRLALMDRSLRNMQAEGKDVSPDTEEGRRNIQEAVWIARTYLDFDQGGSWSKAADPVIPYIGASVQATRGLLRAAGKDPATFAMKSAQLGALAAGLVLAARAVNRDAWDDITDEEKNRYFIITTPFTYKDKDGNKRHTYYRIAKDQGQRALSAVFEGLALMSQGEEFPVSRLVNGIGDALPIVPGASMLAPTMKGLLGIMFNKDFYRNEDIWKGVEVYDKTLEVSRYTQPGYIRLAEAIKPLAQATGIDRIQGFASPERLEYATGQLFARGNPYSWMMGSGFRDVISQLSDAESEDAVQEVLARVPMIRRVYRTTYPDLKPREEVQRLRLEGNDYMVKQRRALDALVDSYLGTDSAEDRQAVNTFIRSQPRTERDKLRARVMWAKRTRGIPNRRWWLDVAQLGPEVRALAFLGRVESLSPEEVPEFEALSRQIPGFRSARFLRALRKLRRQEVNESKTPLP